MPASRDIVVVGAGVIGCATAYELARRGASVEIVDDRPAGMGATQASAGLLAPFVEADAESPLHGLAVRSLELYDDLLARIGARARRRKLVERDRDRRREGARAGPTGSRSAVALGLDRAGAAARDVVGSLLSRAVGRRDGARGGDGGGGGLRRTDNRRRGPRSSR